MSSKCLKKSGGQLLALLEDSSQEGAFSRIANIALKKLVSDTVEGFSIDSLPAQSSLQVASIYRIRQRGSYFSGKNVDGLEETLASLASHDRPVFLHYIHLKKSVIAVWTEVKSNDLGGLLVISKNE